MISRYFHTVRYLKIKQIYYRIIFHLINPKIDESLSSNLRPLINKFYKPVQKKISLRDNETFYFLNKSMPLSEVSWDGPSNTVSKLWRYNQHYFDDLNAKDSLNRKLWHETLLKRWINENKISKGVGWEPYPTSLRIVNWIKWHFSGNILSDSFIHSLELQARWLNKRIEWHILGNHLFSNAKALVFAGLFFSSKESQVWLKNGLKIIIKELKEQVLDDGGNFELSTMYHAIFLEDLLDLINISQSYPKIIEDFQVNEWKNVANKMLKWLDLMIHPDGDISFFNDAAIGIAPNFNELKCYANRLGVKYKKSKVNKVTLLPESGYVRIDSNDLVGLLDVGSIGPDYLPGHAHADTLSFEISLFGQRILVNGGTSEYVFGPVREYERSTKSHNTVEVNNENSSEVWSSFRVARRAYPIDLKIKELENDINISCAHNGYKRFSGKPIHKRHWQIEDSSMIIKDSIEGPFRNAYAYFHFHPSIIVSKNQKNKWSLKMLDGHKFIIDVKIGESQISQSYYSPEFGNRLKTQCLKVSLDKKNGSFVKILW